MSEPKYLVLDGPLKGRSYPRPDGATVIQVPVMDGGHVERPPGSPTVIPEIYKVTYKLHRARQTWTTPSWARDTFYWQQAS